jgi:hypothetical protein
MEIPMHPDEQAAKEQQSWRERRLAEVCGGKILVLAIRPAGFGNWLSIHPDDLLENLIEGEPGDEWELKWRLMTQEEIDAMPEHPGW